jgi:pilus assembly protein CpaE
MSEESTRESSGSRDPLAARAKRERPRPGSPHPPSRDPLAARAAPRTEGDWEDAQRPDWGSVDGASQSQEETAVLKETGAGRPLAVAEQAPSPEESSIPHGPGLPEIAQDASVLEAEPQPSPEASEVPPGILDSSVQEPAELRDGLLETASQSHPVIVAQATSPVQTNDESTGEVASATAVPEPAAEPPEPQRPQDAGRAPSPASEARQQRPASEAADALAQEIQRRRELAAQKAETQSGQAYGGAQPGRIMITEPQPGSADMLRIRLTSELSGVNAAKFEIIGYARDGLEAAQMATQMVPDIILVHESLPGMNGYEACEMISLAAPNVATVLLVDPTRLSQPDVARRALRAGARGVLSADPSTEALLETLHDLIALHERRKQPEYELITDPMKMPVAFAVTGAKGGIGKTTVATNLAVSFAKRFPNEVLLVDFYGQYGNVSLMLNLSPDGTIRDLAGFAHELDINIIETHICKHEASTLRVLAGGGEMVDLKELELSAHGEIAFLADLVGLLRRHYRFVFFDLPPLITQASDYIFSRCQYIMLVTNLIDLNTVRDTATLHKQLLGMHLAPDRVKPIINRVARDNEFSLEDLEQALGMPGSRIAFELPDDNVAATTSINEGVPCVLSRPNSGLARRVNELTDLLVGEMADNVLNNSERRAR